MSFLTSLFYHARIFVLRFFPFPFVWQALFFFIHSPQLPFWLLFILALHFYSQKSYSINTLRGYNLLSFVLLEARFASVSWFLDMNSTYLAFSAFISEQLLLAALYNLFTISWSPFRFLDRITNSSAYAKHWC